MSELSKIRGLKPLEVLSREDRELLHLRSLELLERSGIKVFSAEALRVLKKAGCGVDAKAGIAYIPAYLTEDMLARCRRPVRFCARNPRYDFVYDHERGFLCTDGTGVSTLDMETGARRLPTREDVALTARLTDALPIDIYYPLVTPHDAPGHAHTLHEFEAAFHNTEKHIMSGATYLREEALYEIEMAAALLPGGKEELRRRPIISGVICTTSPLALGVTTDAAIEYARADVPSIVMTMPLVGATGPVSAAGNVLLGNAQVLGLIVVLQLVAPGSPLMYSSVPLALEPKSGAFAAAFPAANLVTAGGIAMAQHYRLPIFVGGWGASAKLPDEQCAYEKALSSWFFYLCGADLTSGPGLLENFTVLSYEQFLLDTEAYTMMQSMLRGIPVNDETLALDVFERVGHEGHYLGQKHTIAHFRELWEPMAFDPRPYQVWEAEGSKGALQRAREKVRAILKEHGVPPLSKSETEALRRIVKEGEEGIPH